MAALSILLLVIFVISAILLLIIVLIQDEQGEGMGGIFGGGGMSGQIGNRKGNFLTRTTTILGLIFFISAVGLSLVTKTDSGADIESAALQSQVDTQAPAWTVAPDNGTGTATTTDSGSASGTDSTAPAAGTDNSTSNTQ